MSGGADAGETSLAGRAATGSGHDSFHPNSRRARSRNRSRSALDMRPRYLRKKPSSPASRAGERGVDNRGRDRLAK